MRTIRGLIFSSLAIAMAAVAQEPAEQPKTIEIDVYYQSTWIMAPTVAEDPIFEDVNVTRSLLLSVTKAVDPDSGRAYDDSAPQFDFRIEDLRHFFNLEKKEFLLGEPILVEHRIELNGPGEWDWFVGGNYRARGRDDNFTFVLRRSDGTIVPDVYPKLEGVIFGGGLGSEWPIMQKKPLSYWLGLQRYSAITEPGTYDLYCFTGHKQKILGEVEALRAALPDEIALDHEISDRGVLVDRETGESSKRYALTINPHYLEPTVPWIWEGFVPREVPTYAKEQHFGSSRPTVGSFGTVAHFRITIRKGTRAEERQMVLRWTKAAAYNARVSRTRNRDQALIESIWYAKQDHFLPQLERWITNFNEQDPLNSRSLHLDGLAMRKDPSAFALLLKASSSQVTAAFYDLHLERIADAIPLCIGWLSHEDNRVRANAESLLSRWTGQSFEHTWNGDHYERTTLAEGQSKQQLWRNWWERNKSTFTPAKPCPFPCSDKKQADVTQ